MAELTSENQQFYFRIKRHKLTIFLKAHGNDKILSLKKELVRILDDKEYKDPAKIRLLKADNNNPPVYTSLDREGETVNSHGLSDEQILYLSYWDDKIGKFESVSVEWPEPDEDDDEDEDDEEVDEDDHAEGDTYHQQVKVDDNISMAEDDDISMEEDGKGKARA
ncbi:hypothetical protein Glove_423g58 [Diversispora epigaea]|uniref:Ubiquitin-like domain-containing protein n=1 Tax=Diversispora epigaea TaxID=1348612 RepID=A0A397GYR5_9GLOM|nr:hypothetical protein Glove_423g58 [Diversispora epigaea]